MELPANATQLRIFLMMEMLSPTLVEQKARTSSQMRWSGLSMACQGRAGRARGKVYKGRRPACGWLAVGWDIPAQAQ